MAITEPGVDKPDQRDVSRARRQRWGDRSVVLLWLVVLLGCALLGEKESHLHDLESALRDDGVSQVEVLGLSEQDAWVGDSVATLRWQGRFVDRYAEVLVVRGEGPTGAWADDLPRLAPAELSDRLRALDPDVELLFNDDRSRHMSGWTAVSWRMPQWLGVATLATWVSTFMLIVVGPEPWRATRWAWLWLMLLGGWVGVAAFVLLGGPLGLGRPRAGSRRLTGGWAFLLALFIGGPSN